MSWRWQVNNNPQQITTLLALQQQRQQQQPVRWLHEYQHQLSQSQLCQQLHLQQQQQQQQQLLQQQQLQHHVHQHQQLQYPLQGRVPSPWLDSRTSESIHSQVHSARRDSYEDIHSARNTRRVQSDNRYNILYHEGKGNDFPLQEGRTEVFYPAHRNGRLLNGIHQGRTEIHEEFLPTRNVQQTRDSDYRCSSLYYQEPQHRFPYDERSKVLHTEEEDRRLLDEQSNEFGRRMWRAHTPCSTFERQHPYHRSLRDRSDGPDQRASRHRSRSVGPELGCSRYRSKSVGPERGYHRNYDTDSGGKRNNGEDRLFFKQYSRKSHSRCSNYTDVGDERENDISRGNSWSTGSNLHDENRFKIKQNAHSEIHQPKFKKRQNSLSPAKDTSSVIDGVKKRRRNVCKQKMKKIGHELAVMSNSKSASDSTHKTPHVQENLVGGDSSTGITRTISNVVEEMAPKSSSVDGDGNDESTSQNWQLTPLEDVALNRSQPPLSGMTRTVLNVSAGRAYVHRVGERNHRLRSFREEEEDDEKTPEDDDDDVDVVDEEEEEEEGGGGGNGGGDDDDEGDDNDNEGDDNDNEGNDNERGGEGNKTDTNEQRERDVETRCVEYETEIDMGQQSTGKCLSEIESTNETESKYDGEKEAQQQLDVPDYNSNVPVGRSLLKWTVGLRCRMCHKFFLDIQQAEQHCQSFEHYNNYVKRLSELQVALNIDPMDGPKALELERLLDDEPPSRIPPESSYLSDMDSDLL